MAGACPVKAIFRRAGCADIGGLEQGVDGGCAGGVGRAGVINNALQLFGVGQPPVAVAAGGGGFGVGQRILPAHRRAAVGLQPHQAGGVVGDGAIAVVHIGVLAIAGVAAHQAHVHGLRGAANRNRIALDAAIGKVDAKCGGVTAHGGADVAGGRPLLRINCPLACAGVAVREIEIAGVQIRRRRAGAGAGVARKLDQRIQLFDGGQPPVAIAANHRRGRIADCLRPGHFLAGGAFHPGQAGVQVGDRAVAVVHVGRLLALITGILAIKAGIAGRGGNSGGVAVIAGLVGVNNGVAAHGLRSCFLSCGFSARAERRSHTRLALLPDLVVQRARSALVRLARSAALSCVSRAYAGRNGFSSDNRVKNEWLSQNFIPCS